MRYSSPLKIQPRREPPALKLGKRLKQIESMVVAQYSHIWDCCCDHGLLGAALLSRQAAPYIHFVDIVPELMRDLESKLLRFYPQAAPSAPAARWQVHCMDVSTLPLQRWNGKHLVIIAGIGGDLMTDLVSRIYQNHPEANLDFLLCPIHHPFTLRQRLIQLDFSLLAEALVVENRRFYEVLLVSNQSQINSPINPVGDLIWQAKNASDYLNKTLAHYQRVQRNTHTNVQHIIDAYNAIVLAESPLE